MIYALSDIHGSNEKFLAMLDLIGFKDQDVLYVLGDVIDRGNGGIATLFDMEKRKNVIPVIGNHESLALGPMKAMIRFPDQIERIMGTKAAALWMASGGETTFGEFIALSESDRKRAFDYINTFAIYDEVEVGGRRFHLSHTLPDYDETRDIHDVSYLEFIYGEPDYTKSYGEGTYFVTGHTPTGLISPEYHGKIYKGCGHIAIDCAAAFGGRLGCICLDTLEEFYV